MPKRLTKEAAEAACAKHLRKTLRRESSSAELAAAVKIYHKSYNATAAAITGTAKRSRKVG